MHIIPKTGMPDHAPVMLHLFADNSADTLSILLNTNYIPQIVQIWQNKNYLEGIVVDRVSYAFSSFPEYFQSQVKLHLQKIRKRE